MKCSSRRNCNHGFKTTITLGKRLNEVQLPKELQLRHESLATTGRYASMKCSSRRNCNVGPQ